MGAFQSEDSETKVSVLIAVCSKRASLHTEYSQKLPLTPLSWERSRIKCGSGVKALKKQT